MSTVWSKEEDGYTAKVVYDQHDVESPREWSNLGHMVTFPRDLSIQECKDRRFRDGDDFMEWWKAHGKGGVLVKVFAYIHSGVTIKAGDGNPFSCPWDSGQAGWIYATAEDIRKNWNVKRATAKHKAKALDILKAEVQTLDDYLTGNAYGFIIEKDGEEVDSCWGFIGDRKHCIEEAESVLKHYARERRDAEKRRKEDYANVMACR